MKRCAFGVCVACLAAAGFGRAEPPPEKEEAPPAAVGRHDQQGDPLPAGAIARLGTVRLDSDAFIVSIAVAPDGETACTYSRDGEVRLWDVQTGKHRRLIMNPEHHPIGVGFAAGGKHVVTVESTANGGRVRRWNVESGKELSGFSTGPDSGFVALSSDGEALAIRSPGGIALWHTGTGKQLDIRKGPQPAKETNPFRPWVTGEFPEAWYGGHDVLSPDGKYLAWYIQKTMRGVARLQVWETASGKKLHDSMLAEKDGSNARIGGFSADGSKLLLWGDGHIWVLDIHTDKTSRRIPLDRDNSHYIALSPDGRYIVAGEGSGLIRLFDLDRNKTARLKGPQGYVTAFAFSHDSKRLFSGGKDNTVLAWDLTAIPEKDFESLPVDYLWWIVAAGVVLLALAVLWKILSLFRGRWLQSA